MNHVKLLAAPALAAALLFVGGCAGKGAKQPVAEAVDTPALEVEEPYVLAALPDTVMPSVDSVGVRFVVDVFDDADSAISNLDDLYAEGLGTLMFRRGPRRDADFGGCVEGTPSDIVIDWEFSTGYNRIWGGGTGWTGQPLYVHWPDSIAQRFKREGLVPSDFSGEEIMFGSLCGNVYFLDYATGKPSRPAISTGNPIKGTGCVDPTLNGNYYVGQGVPDTVPFGAMVIDLNKHEITHFADRDPNAWRGWQAYDSSPVRIGQFLFRPGENGTLYKYIVEPGSLRLHSTLRYRINGSSPGIEASMPTYLNYGYTCDNHGNILCVNLNTMRPVWAYRLGDDIDGTPALAVEDGTPFVYVGCEVDKQGVGTANFVKLDGLTGREVWINRIEAQRVEVDGKHFDGGYYCSPLLGTGDCAHLVFANCVLNTSGRNGIFVAINRQTGRTVYTTELKYYSWSSPVGLANAEGELFVFTGDCAGRAYIIRGATGEILLTKQIGNNFESSPVVIGNSLVLGTRGDKIFKMTIK